MSKIYELMNLEVYFTQEPFSEIRRGEFSALLFQFFIHNSYLKMINVLF